MSPVNLHKDYDPKEFTYDYIEKAWQAINGANSAGRYFFVAHLLNQPFMGGGHWMAFLRRPDKGHFLDVPFNSDQGFGESGDAEIAVHERAGHLDWRIREISVDALPTEPDRNIEGLL